MSRSSPYLRVVAAALALAVSGCSTTPVQCKPCMSSGFVEVQAGRHPAGTTVRVCAEGLGCTEEAFPAQSDDPAELVQIDATVRLSQLDGLEHDELGGVDLTVTLTPPRRASPRPQTVHTTTRYTDGGDGTCACSYLSAERVTFQPAR